MLFDLRFLVMAVVLFAVTFGAVSWTLAGAPLPWFLDASSDSEPQFAPPHAVEPPAPAGSDSHPFPGDGHPLRDKLRLAALQASNAYRLAPCDKAAKMQLLDTVGAYAGAWREMMGCGPNGCDTHKLNIAAAAFSTPLDLRLREAVGAAFDKRGISIDDFPAPLRINVAMLARGRGAPAAACAG